MSRLYWNRDRHIQFSTVGRRVNGSQSFRQRIVVLNAGFDQLTGDILGDFQRLCDRSALGNQTLENGACGQIRPFLKAFNFDGDKVLRHG